MADQAGDVVPQPGDIVPQPGDVVPQPGDIVPQPGAVVPQPGDVVPQPGENLPQAGDVVPQPGDVVPPPGDVRPPQGDVVPPQEVVIPQPGAAIPPRREDDFNRGLPRAARQDPQPVQVPQLPPQMVPVFVPTISKPGAYKHGQNFNRFCTRFKEYMTITRQAGNLEHIKPHFLSLLDDKTYARLSEVQVHLDNVQTIDDILDVYKNTMISAADQQLSRTEMMEIVQLPDESVDDFSFRISELAISAYPEENIRAVSSLNAFLKGLRDNGIKMDILKSSQEGNTFQSAVAYAKKLERLLLQNTVASQQTSELFSISPSDLDQQDSTNNISSEETNPAAPRRRNQNTDDRFCIYCQRNGHTVEYCYKLEDVFSSRRRYRAPARTPNNRAQNARGNPANRNSLNRETASAQRQEPGRSTTQM